VHLNWPAVATSQARELALDWRVLSLTGLCVALLVGTLILLPLVLWRRRDERLPPQFDRNNALEIAYTVIPIVLVTALFVLTYRVEADVERISATPDVTVAVEGFRWSWRFAYPGTKIVVTGTPDAPPQMVLPLDRTARMIVTSADVDHSFWVPDFLFKRDAIPGMRNVFDLRPTRLGTYRGACAEYCGLEHTDMTFSVRVVTVPEYARWVAAANAK
jgi:cytochrome c oxidase subunit II